MSMLSSATLRLTTAQHSSYVINRSCHDANNASLLIQVMMAMPLFGATVNPKSVIRRICLATAVAMITWGMWKHTDSEQETLR